MKRLEAVAMLGFVIFTAVLMLLTALKAVGAMSRSPASASKGSASRYQLGEQLGEGGMPRYSAAR